MAYRQRFFFLLTAGFLLQLGNPAVAADWPRWRGPQDHGSISEGVFPDKLDADHLAWETPLPGKGCSTPISHAGALYVTAPIQQRDAILSLDQNGRQQWQVTFGREVEGKHRNGSGANASPVADASGVFVYFKSGTLAAVTHEGEIRWQTDLVERYGEANLFWDHGTSPVLTSKHVVMVRMHAGDSWLAAFDKLTGELDWKVARNYQTKTENDHGYTTPLVISFQGREALLVWGAERLTIHDAADGELLWTCGKFNPEAHAMWPAISTPVVLGEMAVLSFGRNDRGLPRMYGIRLAGTGDATADAHIWKRTDVGTFVPSLTAYRGNVYVVRDKGEVACLDPQSGKTQWADAFPKHRRSYYASPLVAGGMMYAPREDGVIFVANISESKLDVVSENDMQQPVIGSPIPAGGGIVIRGEQALRCYVAK